jgi:alpha-N-acetylglucosaminidase
MYFDSLGQSLGSNQPPAKIDWFAFGDAWNRSQNKYRAIPEGDSYATAMKVAQTLGIAPR